jgi:hypothetical protein
MSPLRSQVEIQALAYGIARVAGQLAAAVDWRRHVAIGLLTEVGLGPELTGVPTA